MIDVFVKDYGDHWSMRMEGHADYAEPGEDIVCAGASALWFTLLSELQEACDHFETEEEFGDAPKMVTAWGCRYAMRMIRRGLCLLEGAYPEHITVIDGGAL